MNRINVIVSGRVQGVSYRAGCQREAETLKLTGWVRNLPSGAVEFEAEGEDDDISALLRWAKKGPPFAHVSHIEITHISLQHDGPGFHITK